MGISQAMRIVIGGEWSRLLCVWGLYAAMFENINRKVFLAKIVSISLTAATLCTARFPIATGMCCCTN